MSSALYCNHTPAVITNDGVLLKVPQTYLSDFQQANRDCVDACLDFSCLSLNTRNTTDFNSMDSALIVWKHILFAKEIALNSSSWRYNGNNNNKNITPSTKKGSNEQLSLLVNEDYDSNDDSNKDSDIQSNLMNNNATPNSCSISSSSPNDVTNNKSSTIIISNNANIIVIELTYLVSTKDTKNLIPNKILVSFDKDLLLNNPIINSRHTDLSKFIIEKSYPPNDSILNKSLLIVINKFGGKGKAWQIFTKLVKPILDSIPLITYKILFTDYHEHAIDIAKDLNLFDFDYIVCASGDGIPYEIINGLYQRSDHVNAFNKLVVTQLPCGSGNAMSVSCFGTVNPTIATLHLLKGKIKQIDLMLCQQPSYDSDTPKGRLSFLSQTFGVIAECDINTEFIRWMGPIRFDLGVAYNVFQSKNYPCEIWVKYHIKNKSELTNHFIKFKEQNNNTIDSCTTEQEPTNFKILNENDFKIKFPLNNNSDDINNNNNDNNDNNDTNDTMDHTYLINSGWEKLNSDLTENLQLFYAGKMPYMSDNVKFFPNAIHNDGTIDLLLTDSRTPVTKMTKILLSVDEGSHIDHVEMINSKIIAYKLIPKIDNTVISVDGENFPLETLQVEVMPSLLKTALKDNNYAD